MRLDRLLQMVVMLVNRRRMKAQDLAEYFGVSVRTIYRDAETISLAGIPVVSYQGLNGGLGIAEGYRLDRTVLTEEELAGVMLALQSTSGSLPDSRAAAVQEKLQALVTGEQAARLQEQTDSVRIDFGPWGYGGELKNRVELLKIAIGKRELVGFTYCNAKVETAYRVVEPYTLVLKNNHWYLYAFCLEKQDFRFFKAGRMRGVEPQGRYFVKRELDPDSRPWEQEWLSPERAMPLVLRFPRELRHLMEDWFGLEAVLEECPILPSDEGEEAWNQTGQGNASSEACPDEECEHDPGPCVDEAAKLTGATLPGSRDGNADRWLYLRMAWPEDEWLYGYLLSFGTNLEVLHPVHVRQKLRRMAEGVAAMYAPGVLETNHCKT